MTFLVIGREVQRAQIMAALYGYESLLQGQASALAVLLACFPTSQASWCVEAHRGQLGFHDLWAFIPLRSVSIVFRRCVRTPFHVIRA